MEMDIKSRENASIEDFPTVFDTKVNYVFSGKIVNFFSIVQT